MAQMMPPPQQPGLQTPPIQNMTPLQPPAQGAPNQSMTAQRPQGFAKGGGVAKRGVGKGKMR